MFPKHGEEFAVRDSKLVLSFSRVQRLPSLGAKLDAALRRQQMSPAGSSAGNHVDRETLADLDKDSSDEDDFADLFVSESSNAAVRSLDKEKESRDGQGVSGPNRQSPETSKNVRVPTNTKSRVKRKMTKKKLSQIPSGYSGIVVRPTPEQLKKDLNRGSGIVVAQGGGVRKPLNKYGNEVKRRVKRILEIRGRVLGEIVAEQKDLARFLALRDVQMWVIVRRWTQQLMRVNLRAWHSLVVQAKEDAERFRKLFVKSDRQRLKKCFSMLRHAADMGMAQRANAELNNQSADADKQAQKVRDLESRAREYRHRISSLEYQLDTMKQECEDVKDEVKLLREMLDKQKARRLS